MSQGFERSLTKTLNEALRAQRVLRAAEDDVVKDDVARGHDGDRHGPARRAAVRGPDQGGARHLRGHPDRRRRWSAKS